MLFKLKSLKKQTNSANAGVSNRSLTETRRAMQIPAVVSSEDFEENRLQKEPPPPREVSVTKLASGFAPQEDQPIFLHCHNQDDVSKMTTGEGKCKQDELTETTRHDSFSLSSVDSLSEGSPCTLRFTAPDYYGQTHPIETPQLIASKLQSFETQLVAIPDYKKTSLKMAVNKCPALLTDKFKLMFLRCECFNEKKAAKRYAKYWDKRVEVFGLEKAFQPLTLDKALRDDCLALSLGFPTLSPVNHPSGRTLLFGDPSAQNIGTYASLSMVRTFWYVFHAALENEETQKKGVIFLLDARAFNLSQFDQEFARVTSFSVAGCIPVRLSGFHIFSPPKIFFIVMPILKIFLGDLRKRIRLHGGSDMEKVYEGMATYGLVEGVLPTNVGGEVELSHKSWLRERRLTGL